MNTSDTWYQELTLEFEDGTSQVVFLDMTRSGRHVARVPTVPAEWTKLPFQKCPCCTLTEYDAYCPAALALDETIGKLAHRTSIEKVTATAVDSENRRTTVTWPLQQVGAAFVQIAVLSSGCPVGSQFRPMVHDLRPFSTTRELGRHLVFKTLLRHKGEVSASKAAVISRLGPLREIFTHIFKRLQGIPRGASQDAIPNSIVHVHAMTQHLELLVEEMVEEVLREIDCPPTPAPVRLPPRDPSQ
ncbi:MAG: hypothetical protein HY927_05840 [Elusimicrobia bacterium]|nr:hypothetical protein [Elusimicrobiota bacterium]